MQISRDARVRVERVGEIPVLYIDGFYVDPDEVRSAALAARFEATAARYPGKSAPIAPAAIRDVAVTLAAIVTRVTDREVRPEDIDSDFSIVTVPPGDFSEPQRHPHIDPWPLFGIVYLTPRSTEGTSLYFSDVLGYALAQTDLQRRAHESLLDACLAAARNGAPPDERAMWHRIYTIQPLYNRFAMFPGNVLHGIDIVGAMDGDLQHARLTQRFIIRRTHAKRPQSSYGSGTTAMPLSSAANSEPPSGLITGTALLETGVPA